MESSVTQVALIDWYTQSETEICRCARVRERREYILILYYIKYYGVRKYLTCVFSVKFYWLFIYCVRINFRCFFYGLFMVECVTRVVACNECLCQCYILYYFTKWNETVHIVEIVQIQIQGGVYKAICPPIHSWFFNLYQIVHVRISERASLCVLSVRSSNKNFVQKFKN